MLLALGELIDRRWNRVWLLLGAATAFHPLVGGWSGLVCGGIWLVDDRRTKSDCDRCCPGSSPADCWRCSALLPALHAHVERAGRRRRRSARIYVFERLPHHLALLTLPREEIAVRFARHAMLIVAPCGC